MCLEALGSSQFFKEEVDSLKTKKNQLIAFHSHMMVMLANKVAILSQEIIDDSMPPPKLWRQRNITSPPASSQQGKWQLAPCYYHIRLPYSCLGAEQYYNTSEGLLHTQCIIQQQETTVRLCLV